jgi:O-antigen ligase
MPPILALILCTVFVLILLWLDWQESPEVSPVSWIPTVWLLYTASKPMGLWFYTPGADTESGSPLDQIFMISLFCLGLLILAWRKWDWQETIYEHPWLVVLIVYMLLSIVWSDIPFVSFKRWIRELLAFAMASVVLTEQNPRQTVISIFRRSAYILIPFSLLLIKYFPFYGVQYGRWSGSQSWVGVTTQKNGLGRLCLIASFYLVWMLVGRWRKRDIFWGSYQTYADIIVLSLAVFLLLGPGGAYSATAVAALASGLLVYVGLLWMRSRKTGLEANTVTALLACIVIIGTVTVFVGGATVGAFTSTLGRDDTLTGRTDVWDSLIPTVSNQPILGAGFGGFWTPRTRAKYEISEGHSGYLDVILDIGFVGLFLVSIFLLSSCLRAYRELDRDFDWAALWLCYLFMVAIHNITESSLNSLTSHLTAVLLFLAIAYAPDSPALPHDEIGK